MRRIRFQRSAAVLLAAAGITFAVLVGVRRLEALLDLLQLPRPAHRGGGTS